MAVSDPSVTESRPTITPASSEEAREHRLHHRSEVVDHEDAEDDVDGRV